MKKSQTTVFAIVITLITVSAMCLAWDERAVHASRNSKMAPIAFNEESLSPVTSPKLTWTLEQELDIGAAIGPDNPSVGVSVAVSGNTAVIGVHGHNVNGGSRVLVFVRSDVNGTPTWTLDSTLYPDFQPYETWFGYSVAISGDTIVIGAPLDKDETELIKDAKGAAYVFKRNSSWTKQQRLLAADGDNGDLFGSAVAISGDKVLVGAAGDTIFFHEKQGSAYLFREVGTTWIQQWKLFDTNGSAGDHFGRSVALSESKSTVAVGAQHSGPDAGVTFFVSDNTWSQTQKLTGSSSTRNRDKFGEAVSISGKIRLQLVSRDRIWLARHTFSLDRGWAGSSNSNWVQVKSSTGSPRIWTFSVDKRQYCGCGFARTYKRW